MAADARGGKAETATSHELLALRKTGARTAEGGCATQVSSGMFQLSPLELAMNGVAGIAEIDVIARHRNGKPTPTTEALRHGEEQASDDLVIW